MRKTFDITLLYLLLYAYPLFPSETVEKALKGAERVLIVHGVTDFENYPIWAQTVADAAIKSGTVKVISKVS